MRLVRFEVEQEPMLGAEIGGAIVDLVKGAALLGERQSEMMRGLAGSLRSLLAGGEQTMAVAQDVQRLVQRRLSAGQPVEGPNGERIVWPKEEVRVLAPLADTQKLILLGLNYAGHIAEAGRDKPEVPTVFSKYANAITGPFDPIVLPKAAPNRVDYEAELAFVVGKRAKRVPVEQAYEYIAGYMALNDVSARDLQRSQTQWVMGKTPDTFAPMGPCLVTRDEIPDPQTLGIRCIVNGQLLQDSNTSNLIFNVPYLLHHLSQTITLEPGDVVSTGTPDGVGFARKPPIYLHAGDVVRVEIDVIGALENPVIMED